eukprot:259652-Rhodomonas_salina.1
MASLRITVIRPDSSDSSSCETKSNDSDDGMKVKENSPTAALAGVPSKLDTFMRVLQSEATQAKQNRIALAIHWVFYAYFAEILFRNMAFARVNQAVSEGNMMPWRLLDAGHDLTTGTTPFGFTWADFGEMFCELPVYLLAGWVLLLPALGHLCG